MQSGHGRGGFGGGRGSFRDQDQEATAEPSILAEANSSPKKKVFQSGAKSAEKEQLTTPFLAKTQQKQETKQANKRSAAGSDEIEKLASERLNEASKRRLMLKNLPFVAIPGDLKALCPEMIDVRLVKQSARKTSTAFIDFASEQLADKYHEILQKRNKLHGQTFIVDYCGTKSANKPKELTARKPTSGETDPLKLYIRGLHKDATVAEIRALFREAIDIIRPGRRVKKNKAASAFAFVQFADETAAKNAFFKAQGATLKGVPVTVLFAFKKNAGDQNAHDATTEEEMSDLDEDTKAKLIARLEGRSDVDGDYDEEESEEESPAKSNSGAAAKQQRRVATRESQKPQGKQRQESGKKDQMTKKEQQQGKQKQGSGTGRKGSVSVAGSERSFSANEYLRNYLRTRLALMYIQDDPPSPEELAATSAPNRRSLK